jgi:hypothetical protein
MGGWPPLTDIAALSQTQLFFSSYHSFKAFLFCFGLSSFAAFIQFIYVLGFGMPSILLEDVTVTGL